eukprot:1187180-Prorocentrum_minimum.AAC.2
MPGPSSGCVVQYVRVRRGSGGGREGKYRSSVASLVSLRTRLKAKNTRRNFKVCCTVHEGRKRPRSGGGRARTTTHPRAVVPTAVEQHDLSRRRQLLDIPLRASIAHRNATPQKKVRQRVSREQGRLGIWRSI